MKQLKSGEQRKPNLLLREQRLLRGWSLQRVVEELCALSSVDDRLPGVNAPMVSNWETGTKKPSPFYQERLCKLYNMSADQLGFMDSTATSQVTQNQTNFTAFADQITQLIPSIGSENKINMAFDAMKRETILKLLNVVGTIAIARLNTELWERLSSVKAEPSIVNLATLDHFEHLIGDCWDLSNINELEIAESILVSFLPKLLALPAKEGKVASLASHGLRLQSIFVHHRLHISDKVQLCEESVNYARLADDANSLVTALLELAMAYKYNNQPEKWFKTLHEALYYNTQASPLVQSQVYLKSSLAFAYHKRLREAELYFQMAFDVFPDHPELDPGYRLVDSSIYTLSRDAGRAQLEMGHVLSAESAFETYKQHSLKLLIPERIRLEIVNGQARAAIQEDDLEKYVHFLEDGIVSAIALGSKKRFDETCTIFREETPASWLSHSKIQHIAEQYHLMHI